MHLLGDRKYNTESYGVFYYECYKTLKTRRFCVLFLIAYSCIQLVLLAVDGSFRQHIYGLRSRSRGGVE